jgi:hypothetical protein
MTQATTTDYTVPSTQPTITIGEIRKLIANMPDDRPVTILTPGGDWLNIDGFQDNYNPDGDGEPSAMFSACDDFDTRQW